MKRQVKYLIGFTLLLTATLMLPTHSNATNRYAWNGYTAQTVRLGEPTIVSSETPLRPKDCARDGFEVASSWAEALKAAQRSFQKHRHRIKRKDLMVLINYDTLAFDPKTKRENADRLRIYDIEQNWKPIQSNWVSHAAASGIGCARRFSNEHESYLSSRGAFVTNRTLHRSPRFGYPALKVHGLEIGVNDHAHARAIIFHEAMDGQSRIDYSLGCFMTRPAINKTLLKQIKGGRFLYVHTSAQ